MGFDSFRKYLLCLEMVGERLFFNCLFATEFGVKCIMKYLNLRDIAEKAEAFTVLVGCWE